MVSATVASPPIVWPNTLRSGLAGAMHSSDSLLPEESVASTVAVSSPVPNRQNTPPRSAKPEPVTVTFVPPSAGPP